MAPWHLPPRRWALLRPEENFGDAPLELTAGDLRDITAAADKLTLQGARYPEHLQKLIGR